jgi:membrane protease YdiL (CAAX protease family)
MHIIAAAARPDPLAPLWPALLLAIATATFVALGVYRRRGIVGPQRWDSSTALELFAIALCTGLGALFCVSALAMWLAGAAVTDPPNIQEVAADILGRMATVAVMLAIFRLPRHGKIRLGLAPAALPTGIIYALVAILLVLPLVLLVSGLWSNFFLKEQHTHDLLVLLGNANDTRMKEILFGSILIAAPVSEEIFFRGTLQTMLSAFFSRWIGGAQSAAPRWIAVILTSALFACVHPIWSWPPIFVLALCLGYAYERTGNLWTSIIIHAMFNAAEVCFFYQTL